MEVPELIEVIDRTTVRLTWANGEESEFGADALRRACSCADCVSSVARGRLRLTVVGAEPTIEDARLVGDYGLSLVFGPDGHRTGIFRWDGLARLSGLDVSAPADSSDTST